MPVQDLPVQDLQDWGMVKGSIRVGRMVKPSTMLYLSTHFSFHCFVAAPVCEVHPDLVLLRTGKGYKLHSPSVRYLASLSIYMILPTQQSAELSLNQQLNMQDIPQRKSVGKSEPRLADRDADGEYMTALPDQPSTSKMDCLNQARSQE